MPEVTLGPIVGAVDHDRVKIWFQTERPGSWQLDVRRASGARISGSPFGVKTTLAASNTCVAEIPLPRAYSHYSYDIQTVGGDTVLPGFLGTPSFWSAPEPDTAGSFSFGLSSCHKLHAYADLTKAQSMWKALAKATLRHDLAFLINAGDQLYADDAWRKAARRTDPSPRDLRRLYQESYEKQWAVPELRRVWANLPSYMIWDDHEIRNGWGSLAADSTDPNRRDRFAAARYVYRRFQHAHNPSTFSTQALHYAFRHGNVGFVVLDLRGQRTWSGRALPVMGSTQWTHVRRWLARNGPSLGALFVVSSVPVFHIKTFFANLPRTDLRDQWASTRNRPERRMLLELLFGVANDHDIPVVLLGGDVHVGTMASLRSYRPEHQRHPLIHQLTSSPISNAPAGEALTSIAIPSPNQEIELEPGFTGRMYKPVFERNYGVVDAVFDGTPERYRVVLNLFTESGRHVRRELT